VPFEELQIDTTEGFKPENLRYAKVNEPLEAKSIVEYKLKFIYPDKQCLLAVPHLVNIPVWSFKFLGKKLDVFGNDENYKKTVITMLEKNFPKKGKTKSELFLETIKDIKKPQNFLKDFIHVFKKTNKWALFGIVIIIVIIIYFIITKIIAKIS